MKHSTSRYAQALARVILGAEIGEKKLTENFLKLLERNGDIKKAGRILAQAEQLILKKTGNKKVILEIARKNDTKNVIKSFIKKGDMIEEKINPALIAGVKIIVDGERQLDFSLQKKLQEVFKLN